nr:DUF308 domain-containing protein [uncultured Actinoplanes sp.]
MIAPGVSSTVRQRTWPGVILGGILIGTGVVVLGDVVAASVISVLLIGWILVIGGALGIVAALMLIGRGAFWIGMLGGVLALVCGLVFLRNPGTTLLAFSLALGAVLLINGISRLVAAVQHEDARGALVLTGLLSLATGIWVFGRWPTSALSLIGILLSVQLVVDGLMLILVGRPVPARGQRS